MIIGVLYFPNFVNLQAVEMSQNNSYWHCRLLFQLASIHAAEKDYASAVSILGAGVDFAYVAGAYYTRLLFMLSKTMASTEHLIVWGILMNNQLQLFL